MFFKKTVRIVIKNQNLAIEAQTGTNLYQALVNEKVIPPTLCRGNGQCGKCKVHISQKNIVKPNRKEQLVLARINLEAGYRLACQNTIKGDMIVDTSEITSNSPHLDMPVRTVQKQTSDTPQEATSMAAPVNEVAPQREEAAATPKATVREKAKEKPDESSFTPVDGLLLAQSKKQLRYFLYSAAIDGIAQEGLSNDSSELKTYLENGMLSDYVYDVLKIKDIDRIIILSNEPSSSGDNLFNIASYTPFDIGAMPCELICPQPDIGDLSLFLRLLSVKGKKKLIIPLDRLDRSYYFADDAIIELPQPIPGLENNLFDITPLRDNPITEISDDLRTITTAKMYHTPDSLPLPIMLKIAAQMVKRKLADSELRIYHRNHLDASVPLEYVVKLTNYQQQGAFYLFRDKESSLMLTQDMLSKITLAKKYIHYAIEYTEANLGNIEAIMITTPTPQQGLLDSMLDLGMIPKRHEGITVHNSSDSAVIALKLFQEPDVRRFINKNYGNFRTAEQ